MKNFLARAIAVVAGSALFVGAFVVSVFFFAAAFAIALLFLGFFLWKTRHLRRQMRQQFDQRDVIEGTVIRERPAQEVKLPARAESDSQRE